MWQQRFLCKDEVFIELPVQNNEDWETHEPVINRNGDSFSVNIASDDHPWMGDHHIDVVILQYEKGIVLCILIRVKNQKKVLSR